MRFLILLLIPFFCFGQSDSTFYSFRGDLETSSRFYSKQFTLLSENRYASVDCGLLVFTDLLTLEVSNYFVFYWKGWGQRSSARSSYVALTKEELQDLIKALEFLVEKISVVPSKTTEYHYVCGKGDEVRFSFLTYKNSWRRNMYFQWSDFRVEGAYFREDDFNSLMGDMRYGLSLMLD